MASIKKGTLTRTPSQVGWNVHLRAVGKRLFWKLERKTAKSQALAQARDRP